MADLVLRNGIVVRGPRASQPFVGDVGIEGSQITFVQAAVDGPERHEVGGDEIDASGHIILPGLVNAHLHAVPGLFRAAFSAIRIDEHVTSPLIARLYEALLEDEDAAMLGARLVLGETLMAGSTSVALMDYLDAGLAARVAADLGIGGAASAYVGAPDCEETLALFGELGLRPMLWAPNEDDSEFTQDLAERAVELACAHGARVHMHVSESGARHRVVVDRHGMSPVKHLESLGLLEHVYAVHCTFIDDDDIEMLARRSVPVVITPASEALLGDGVTPVRRLLDAGVRVALGTDGGPWAGSDDMFGEMRAAALLNRASGGPDAVTGAELVEMATTNGARALGIDGATGAIEVGKQADLLLLNARAPHLRPMIVDGPLATARDVVAFAATGADVCRVIIGGRTVYERGAGPLLSAAELASADAAAARVWSRCGGDRAASWLG